MLSEFVNKLNNNCCKIYDGSVFIYKTSRALHSFNSTVLVESYWSVSCMRTGDIFLTSSFKTCTSKSCQQRLRNKLYKIVLIIWNSKLKCFDFSIAVSRLFFKPITPGYYGCVSKSFGMNYL